jgi:hypothetical protein
MDRTTGGRTLSTGTYHVTFRNAGKSIKTTTVVVAVAARIKK